MEGKADGKFVTSAQSAYPPELCRALAGAFVASFREFSEEKRHQAVEEIIEEDNKMRMKGLKKDLQDGHQ